MTVTPLVVTNWARIISKIGCIVKRGSDKLQGMITKRLLGVGFMIAAAVAVVGIFAVNLLGLGRYAGIGPAQQAALAAAALLFLVGASLWPLGERPA